MESHQELVRRAQSFAEQAAVDVAKDPYRHGYHIMAPAGWINDPNGLVYFKGEYHVFFQYHPYSAVWGPMHWGHVRSKDLVHWEHLPVALAPSEEYDRDGCFSGSAVDDNGVLTLIYTGNVYAGPKAKQVQCITTSTDDVRFEKYVGNPVIAQPPVDGSADFRDPKVWMHDGKWYMVVGSGKEGVGRALLYSSSDLCRWEYVGVLSASDGSLGYMWECPDLFPLADKHILIISPMGMPGHKNIYMVGTMDYTTGKFTRESYAELDYGADFYAAQTFLGPDGRRILFGWMNMWGTKQPTEANGWAGALTLPRELKLLPDGTLSQNPVSELRSLRRDHYYFSDLVVTSGASGYLDGVTGDQLEIIAEFDLHQCDASQFGVKVRCSADGSQETRVVFRPKEEMLEVDRSQSGLGEGGCRGGKLDTGKEGVLRLHIFLDRSSVELFGNEGRIALSSRVYPEPSSQGVDVFAEDGSVKLIRLEAWRLQSIW